MSKFAYCSKHFVSLVWFDQDVRLRPEDEWRFFALSGFIMSFDDVWYLATAGHIQKDIEFNRKNDLTRVRSVGLVDHGGVQAAHKDSIPFDYDSAWKFSIYQEDRGIDFGMIHIEPYYQRLMEANNVSPITEKHWDTDEQFATEETIILGCPRSHAIRLGGIHEGESNLSGEARIVPMPVEMVPGIDHSKEFPRLCLTPTDERIVKYDHVDGFSGAPVIAFGPRNSDGTISYRVLGMQHSWDGNQRIIWANPLELIGKLFQKHLAGELID